MTKKTNKTREPIKTVEALAAAKAEMNRPLWLMASFLTEYEYDKETLIQNARECAAIEYALEVEFGTIHDWFINDKGQMTIDAVMRINLTMQNHVYNKIDQFSLLELLRAAYCEHIDAWLAKNLSKLYLYKALEYTAGVLNIQELTPLKHEMITDICTKRRWKIRKLSDLYGWIDALFKTKEAAA